MLKAKNRKQQNPRSTDNAVIYVRNCAKRAIMLTLPKVTSLQVIKERISAKMKIHPDNQLLFLHGRVVQEENSQIELEDKYIFHLVNLKKVHQPKLTLHFKKLEKESELYTFSLPSDTLIQNFINSKLELYFENIMDFFFVYTGRQLNQHKTFTEEFVQDQSEILCIHRVHNLKKQIFASDQKSSDNSNSHHENTFSNNEQQYPLISSKNQSNENKNTKNKYYTNSRNQEKQEQPTKQKYLSNLNSQPQQQSSLQKCPRKIPLNSASQHQSMEEEKQAIPTQQTISKEDEGYGRYSLKRNKNAKVIPSRIFNPHQDYTEEGEIIQHRVLHPNSSSSN